MKRFSSSVAVIALSVAANAAPAAAQGATAILIPGAGGPVPIDFLMRNVASFNSAGVQTIVASSAQEAVAAASQLRRQQRRVVIVGMSRGGLTTAQALAAGASVDGAVFVSSNYNQVRSILGSSARLPPTLVVHHRDDACPPTTPSSIPSFRQWAGGRVSVAMFSNEGPPVRGDCGPRGAHGYFMSDAAPIAAIVAFVRSR
ncbi:MAG: hypothetical protein JWN07_1176 [Hyphomicrobiales bacterium]|nr:hypothetical protein [Hyphomicrobiales bacterium]